MRLFITCSAAAFIVLACKTRNNLDLARPQITGGKDVNSDEPPPEALAVAAVLSTNPNMVCTGTIYKESYILTAGHCLDELLESGYSEEILVYFGAKVPKTTNADGTTDFNPKADPDHTRTVEWIVRHHEYRSPSSLRSASIEKYNYPEISIQGKVKRSLNDIALVKMSAPAPAPYRSVELFRSQEAIERNTQTITLLGYGCDEIPGVDWGTLRTVQSRDFIRTQREKDFNQIIVLASDGKGVCQGDSGGPIFLTRDNKILLGGVLSRGYLTENNDGSQHGGIYSFPADYETWINGWFENEPCQRFEAVNDSQNAAAQFTVNGKNLTLTSGTKVTALYMESNSAKPRQPEGRVQVRLEEDALASTDDSAEKKGTNQKLTKGTMGVIDSKNLICVEQQD